MRNCHRAESLARLRAGSRRTCAPRRSRTVTTPRCSPSRGSKGSGTAAHITVVGRMRRTSWSISRREPRKLKTSEKDAEKATGSKGGDLPLERNHRHGVAGDPRGLQRGSVPRADKIAVAPQGANVESDQMGGRQGQGARNQSKAERGSLPGRHVGGEKTSPNSSPCARAEGPEGLANWRRGGLQPGPCRRRRPRR